MKGIMIDNDCCLEVENKTLKIGDNTAQCAMLVLMSQIGEWKENATLGCNPNQQISGKMDAFWLGNAKKQLKRAGVEIESISVDGEEVKIVLKKERI